MQAATARTVTQATPTRAAEMKPPRLSIPIGLAKEIPVSGLMSTGFASSPTYPATTPVTPTHKTGRHRGEGGLPTGKSRSRNPSEETVKIHIGWRTVDTSLGFGRESGYATSPTAIYVE